MDHNNSKPIVTRFAPSPTGYMHIGNVRTALYAYLYAKKHKGTFILRIEDTDKSREVVGAIGHIQEALRWLGIEWDYGPDNPGHFESCLQSDRLHIYKKYALQLVEKGLAYPDPYTQEELTSFRDQAEQEKRSFLFREHRPKEMQKWDGAQPLRFKVPEIKRYEWQDVVRGKLSAGPEMLDDFILIKADGYPTYNFAHVVDDLEMGVTHVMRGEEFISSTPKFLSLYDAMEIPWPVFVTLPPIMGPDGKKKLSKRDGAKDLLDYRKDGYLPEAMRNFLALIGWNPGGDEEFLPDAVLVERFSLEKIQRSGGAFNEEKLRWMNKKYLELQPLSFKMQYLESALPAEVKALPQYNSERLERMVAVVFERVHTKEEILNAATSGEYNYAFSAPEYSTELLRWKNDNDVTASLTRLEQASVLLEKADFSSPDSIKSALWNYADEVGRGELLWPLRIALSGLERSPDPFTIAHIIGREETLSRIAIACGKIRE